MAAPEPLTPAEVARVIGACSRRAPTGIRNRALITLLYRSGLRISEALALRPADVNLDKHSLRLLDTKSGEPQTRGFHPSADDALLRWLDERKRLGIGNHGKRLFCTLEGKPLSDRYVRDVLQRLAARAGVDKRVHPHGLRHTFAVELEAAGTPVTTISKLLGHSSIAVTHRYLDHLTNGQAVEALSALELPALDEIPPDQPQRTQQRAQSAAKQPPTQPAAPASVSAPIAPVEPASTAPGPEPAKPPACKHPSEAWDYDRDCCGLCGGSV
jgi:integrase